jgi:hypothetical protein
MFVAEIAGVPPRAIGESNSGPVAYVGPVLGLILVATALGLPNFAAAIGIGLSGVDARVRLRVAIVFGVFETAMPLLGLFLGRQLAASFGSASSYVCGHPRNVSRPASRRTVSGVSN